MHTSNSIKCTSTLTLFNAHLTKPHTLLSLYITVYTSSVGFRPIQSQQSTSQSDYTNTDRVREPDVLPLTPTPVRNPRPPLLATPPGFPPPYLPQGLIFKASLKLFNQYSQYFSSLIQEFTNHHYILNKDKNLPVQSNQSMCHLIRSLLIKAHHNCLHLRKDSTQMHRALYLWAYKEYPDLPMYVYFYVDRQNFVFIIVFLLILAASYKLYTGSSTYL